MLYFRGCTAREKLTSIQDATEKLLKLAGVDYHVLDEEKCCGSVLLRTGFLKEAKEQIEKNTEILKGETIITSCAGCYKTLTEDYEGLDVIHISQLLSQLISENKLKLSKKDFYIFLPDNIKAFGGEKQVYAWYNKKIDAIECFAYTGNFETEEDCYGGYDGFGRFDKEYEIIQGAIDEKGHWTVRPYKAFTSLYTMPSLKPVDKKK